MFSCTNERMIGFLWPSYGVCVCLQVYLQVVVLPARPAQWERELVEVHQVIPPSGQRHKVLIGLDHLVAMETTNSTCQVCDIYETLSTC